MPRRPYRPSAEAKFTVREAAKKCLPQDLTASLIMNPDTGKAIAATTLRSHFQEEIKAGRAEVVGRCMERLYEIVDRSQDETAVINAAKFIVGRHDGGVLSDVKGDDDQEDMGLINASIQRKLGLELDREREEAIS